MPWPAEGRKKTVPADTIGTLRGRAGDPGLLLGHTKLNKSRRKCQQATLQMDSSNHIKRARTTARNCNDLGNTCQHLWGIVEDLLATCWRLLKCVNDLVNICWHLLGICSAFAGVCKWNSTNHRPPHNHENIEKHMVFNVFNLWRSRVSAKFH